MLTKEQMSFLKTLADPEYRQVFAEEHVGTGLAFQIRGLRERRELTQEQLEGITGKAQETISQWENPNYGRYTLSTLKRLASAFDVALLVRFVPFSGLVDWTTQLTPDRLAPPSYDEEVKQAYRDSLPTQNKLEETATSGVTVTPGPPTAPIASGRADWGDGYEIEQRELNRLALAESKAT